MHNIVACLFRQVNNMLKWSWTKRRSELEPGGLPVPMPFRMCSNHQWCKDLPLQTIGCGKPPSRTGVSELAGLYSIHGYIIYYMVWNPIGVVSGTQSKYVFHRSILWGWIITDQALSTGLCPAGEDSSHKTELLGFA